MGQHFLDEESLLLRIHDGYHTVLVSADVENRLPGLSSEVRRGKSLLEGREVRPVGPARDFQKSL